MPGHHPPYPPSLSWGCTKRRSGPEHRSPGKQGRVRGHGSRDINACMLEVNHVVAALPQAPQGEAGPEFGCLDFVVDDTGLASGEAVAHRSGLQRKTGTLEANARQVPAPRTDSPRGFSSEQRPQNLRTIPAAEDANQYEVRKSQFTQFRLTNSEEKLDYPAAPPRAPPTLYIENPRATRKRHRIELPNLVQDYNLRTQQAAEARSLFRRSSRGGGKPNSSALRHSFLHARKKLPKKLHGPIAIFSQVPEKYSRPPHPLEVGGKVSHVNICPVCEKYTVTELDRSAASGTSETTTLRARFQCGLCREVFDLGIALFDPRGIPGVTMYRNEERFRPPVIPRGRYPCPRCWKNTHTSFQCMVVYLREESKVPCEPACPAERLEVVSSCDWGKPEEKEKEKIMEARNVIRTVLGLL